MTTMLRRCSTAAAVLAVATGCSSNTPAYDESAGPGAEITIGGDTRTAQSVSCEQINWQLIVQADADPTQARALLRLDGPKPVARTVNVEDFDGFYGVSGDAVQDVDTNVTRDGGAYIISGTIRGTDRKDPANTATLPYRFEVRC